MNLNKNKAKGVLVLLVMLANLLHAQTNRSGFPEWPLVLNHISNNYITPVNNQLVDFKPTVLTPAKPAGIAFSANTSIRMASASPAYFTGCAQMAFYCLHTGVYLNASVNKGRELKIFAADGTELTNANTRLNCSPRDGEVQVVPIAGQTNQWMIIYNQNDSDNYAGLTNYIYTPLLYSIVKYENGALNFIKKDVQVGNETGDASLVRYFDYGKAISTAILEGNELVRYLYVRQHGDGTHNASNSSQSSSLETSYIQFRLTATEITEKKRLKTGEYRLTWADVATSIEMNEANGKIKLANFIYSENGSKLVLMEFKNHTDFGKIIAPTSFKFEVIPASSFLVAHSEDQSDGTGYDKQSVPQYRFASGFKYKQGNYLSYFINKLAQLEFSPSGNYLYVTGGGYVDGGYTNLSYLGQIDLVNKIGESQYYLIRLKVQNEDSDASTIVDAKNNNTGAGCHFDNAQDNCYRGFHGISTIEKAYNNKIYFTKTNSNKLYCINNPDMPFTSISLKPTEVLDNEPGNITLLVDAAGVANVLHLPDAIDQEFYKDESITDCPECCRSMGLSVQTRPPFCNATDIIFNVTCTNVINGTYTWNFGDGTIANYNAAQKMVAHAYSAAGTYTVTVTQDKCPGSIITKEIKIDNCTFPCEDCISSFAPNPGDYMISLWVKEEQPQAVSTYTSGVEIRFYNNSNQLMGAPVSFTANVPGNIIIDGWQKVEGKFTVPANAYQMAIELKNNATDQSVDAYFDDIRVHPFNAGFKSYVYDPVNLRLMAELDQNNYATIYEYDEEGKLIRIKKETERGIKTIKESVNNTRKQ